MLADTDTPEFLTRATQRLRREPPGWLETPANVFGDHTHDPVPVLPFTTGGPPRPAAVLVPVILHDDGPAILFTERSTGLREHSGQIAFPGGKMDTNDPSPLETALREAEEEIGLSRSAVKPIGYLDAYLSSSNYLVLPVVGLVTPPVSLTLNPGEVASTFEVPVSFLMDPNRHELHQRELRGRQRRYYAMPFGERYIWGVTAGILRNLYERLYG
ncbi:MAG: CoA pyrophosphatase [Pseudomonadota bacterium]|nr:CoA pyrophosphatase [Pseudomonadota bacterium]